MPQAFPVKRPNETLDYTVEVDDWLITGRQIVSATVVIEKDSREESPIALTFNGTPEVVISSTGDTSPALDDRMTINLSGGSIGAVYTLRFDFTDDSTPIAKIGTRRINIRMVGPQSALLIQEVGTVVTNANTFALVDDWIDFWALRADAVAYNADNHEIEAALVKASDYMQQAWRLMWTGGLVDALQPLSWPRRGVPVPDFFDPFARQGNVPRAFQDTFFVPENQIPSEVKTAQILLARETMNSSGVSSLQELQSLIERTTKVEKVGSLMVEYESAESAADGGRITQFYWNAFHVIEPFTKASAPHTGRVVRS